MTDAATRRHAERAQRAQAPSAGLRDLRVSGAEAVLGPADHLGRTVLAKCRVPKAYRHATLDAALRDGRTRDEANLLVAARAAGVPVPVVYDSDRAGGTLMLEPIAGRTLREQLEADAAAGPRASKVADARLHRLGKLVRLLHDHGLAHGDPTTSNVLVPDGADPHHLVLIDFGLGAFTEDAEDRAVDLHLLEEALEATDDRAGDLFAAFLAGYGTGGKADAALRRLEAIRERGRYR
ncbi:MAG TPA: KEOPS complex kinase/ATPase Bud32 [Candidatus Thermoplasmatota archaeon]|nr:KEOPS complex kinase/ATPase Bud32 [Candidatus Thermoplasmatota archaeon]